MNFWLLLYRFGWLAVLALSLAGLWAVFVPPYRQRQQLQKHEQQVRDEVRLEEEMLAHLKRQQERLLTDSNFVEHVAREELGVVRPGELVVRFSAGATSTPPAVTNLPPPAAESPAPVRRRPRVHRP